MGNIKSPKLYLILLIVTILVNVFGYKSQAIPTFSRKYNTSCVTCHAVYPKLNPFGEAFRASGYKYPTNDEEKVKEEPLVLGSDAYKKVWPKSVWPSSIPRTSPISIRGRSAYEATTVNNQTTAEFTRPAIQLLAAGSIGENISVFAGVHLFENGEAGSIDRLYVKFNNLFPKYVPEHLINVQIGQFIPELVPFATLHRGLTNSAYAFNTYDPSMGRSFVSEHSHGGSAFGLEAFQLGVELNGVALSRLRYALGVVNGSGTEVDINADKDYYGRLCYKIGGMGYDGSVKEGANTDKEKSVAIGVFGYNGLGTRNKENFNFYRMGTDFNIYYNDLNFIGGYIIGANGTEEIEKYDLYYAEIDYQMYPWLVGILRYEQANPNTLQSVRQIVPHISALVVANMKFKVETRLDPDDLRFNNLYLGFEFAF